MWTKKEISQFQKMKKKENAGKIKGLGDSLDPTFKEANMDYKDNNTTFVFGLIVPGILLLAVVVSLWNTVNADFRNKKTQSEYIKELETRIDEYEQELTDIAQSTGLLDDINLEIQIKQNELDNLNQQIEEANKELEGQ